MPPRIRELVELVLRDLRLNRRSSLKEVIYVSRRVKHVAEQTKREATQALSEELPFLFED